MRSLISDNRKSVIYLSPSSFELNSVLCRRKDGTHWVKRFLIFIGKVESHSINMIGKKLSGMYKQLVVFSPNLLLKSTSLVNLLSP